MSSYISYKLEHFKDNTYCVVGCGGYDKFVLTKKDYEEHNCHNKYRFWELNFLDIDELKDLEVISHVDDFELKDWFAGCLKYCTSSVTAGLFLYLINDTLKAKKKYLFEVDRCGKCFPNDFITTLRNRSDRLNIPLFDYGGAYWVALRIKFEDLVSMYHQNKEFMRKALKTRNMVLQRKLERCKTEYDYTSVVIDSVWRYYGKKNIYV